MYPSHPLYCDNFLLNMFKTGSFPMLLGGTVERTKFILLPTKLKFNKLFSSQ